MTPTDLALGLLWTLATGHPDAALLAAYAGAARVPREGVWAIAWQETRHNLNPGIRGGLCRGKRDCEVGRMQVKPSTARRVCPSLDIFTYDGNVRCSVGLLRSLYERRGSWALAIRAYQCPSCTHATVYEKSVVSKIGYIELRLKELQPWP